MPLISFTVQHPGLLLSQGVRVIKQQEIKAVAKTQLVRPIIEFFELWGVDSKRGASAEIFADVWEGKTSRFLSGVKDELLSARGIYVFYDSRGRAIYAGKAERQSLWKELNLAYNRNRGDLQTIKRVARLSEVSVLSLEKDREVRLDRSP